MRNRFKLFTLLKNKVALNEQSMIPIFILNSKSFIKALPCIKVKINFGKQTKNNSTKHIE